MSIYEYNEAEHMKMEREDAYADGHKSGFADGHKLGFEDGQKAGNCDGQNRMLQLIRKMTEDGMVEQIPNLTSPGFLEEMLSKYHLAD